MMMLSGQGRVYLYRGVCDLRRSFDRLSQMVAEELAEDPLSGDWFIFLSADRRKVKILVWDRDGYVLWYKRLENGKFVIPDGNDKELDRTGLIHLLEGINARVMKRQPRFRRENVRIVNNSA